MRHIAELPLLLATAMNAKLRDNKHKTGWQLLSKRTLLFRISKEMKELKKALDRRAPLAEVVSEAADVANYLAMLCANYESELYDENLS